MKKLIALLTLSPMCFSISLPAFAQNRFGEAIVTKYFNADTIEVSINDTTKKVKMIGVDTPKATQNKVPFYSKEASDYTIKMLPLDSTIYLQNDKMVSDKSGCLLSYVWYKSPTTATPTSLEIKQNMHNAKLLSNGYAKVNIVKPNIKYATLFTNLSNYAKKNHIGIWQVKNSNNQYKKQLKTQEKKTPRPIKNNATKQPKNNTPVATNGKIKGNINKKGDKIYHVPGGAFYDRTDAEEYFNTEAEAQAAGYRRSMR